MDAASWLFEKLKVLDNRRLLQARRYDILNDNGYLHMLNEISRRKFTTETKMLLEQFLDLSVNPLKTIIHKLAQVYRAIPSRKFANDADTALWQVVTDPNWDLAMEQAQIVAMACNECIIRPVLRYDTIELDIILPHLCEIMWDGRNPLAILYKVDNGYVYLDGEIEAVMDDKGVIVWQQAHNVGKCPIVVLRRAYSVTGGWIGTSGEDLVNLYFDQTMSRSWINCVIYYQSHKELAKRPATNVDSGQFGNPSQEEIVGPGSILEGDYVVLDLRTDVAPLMGVTEDKLRRVASNWGISAEILNNSTAESSIERQMAHASLDEVRESQIKVCRPVDIALMNMTCNIWNYGGMGGTFSGSAPSIDYKEPRRVATPLDELMVLEEECKLGLNSPVKQLRRDNPDVASDAEALEILKENLNETGLVLEARSKYALPLEVAAAYGSQRSDAQSSDKDISLIK